MLPRGGLTQVVDLMFKVMTLAALLSAVGPVLATEPQRVAFTSIGKARIGMSERTLVRALGAPLTHVAAEVEEEGCYYASGRDLPQGVGLMMIDGRLARIDVSEAGVPTMSGTEVGTSEAKLKQLYGTRLIQQPHAYTGPEGHYLTVQSDDGRYGIRFETDGALVTRFYAGTASAIQYIEGCQ